MSLASRFLNWIVLTSCVKRSQKLSSLLNLVNSSVRLGAKSKFHLRCQLLQANFMAEHLLSVITKKVKNLLSSCAY